VIGFCGLAYVGYEASQSSWLPTDLAIAKWIVGNRVEPDALFGPAGAMAFGGRHRMRLRGFMQKVYEGLASIHIPSRPRGATLQLLVSGYRLRRKRMIQFHMQGTRTVDGIAWIGSLRRVKTEGYVAPVVAIGDIPAPSAIRNEPVAEWRDESYRDFLVAIVKDRSKACETVGPDVMAITLRRNLRRVDVYFDAAVEHSKLMLGQHVPVDYRPWVIAPNLLAPPSHAQSGGRYVADGWEFVMEGKTTVDGFWAFSMDPPSKPPPGAR